ncbi:MAG: NAD-binding protein [Desulfovibrionaceae bacterium]|nr:NAD-binding protein [Desulfovibrionaceae bacterium]
MKTRVLLIGGRSKARILAQSLLERGYQVTVINSSYADCEKLAQNERLKVIAGDGSRPCVLEDAGAGEADIAIALTPADEDNLVICELCKKKFQIPKTISLLSDPKKTAFFYKMGVDRVICAISVVAGIIEQQAFMDELISSVPIGEGRVRICELPVAEGDRAVRKLVRDLDLPKEVIIGCILRQSQTLIPKGDTEIFEGDILVLISSSDQDEVAIRKLKGELSWRK